MMMMNYKDSHDIDHDEEDFLNNDYYYHFQV